MKWPNRWQNLVTISVLLLSKPLCPASAAEIDYIHDIDIQLDNGGAPITSEQTIRFSLWDIGTMEAGDITNGIINTSSQHYANFQGEKTYTPNGSGWLTIHFRDIANFPTIDDTNFFIMIEYKSSGAPDSSYQPYKNADMTALMLDHWPLIEEGFTDFYIMTKMEETMSRYFTIDAWDKAGTGQTIDLTFGHTMAETLVWDIDTARFQFSDDLLIQGNLDVTGTMSGAALTVSGTGASPILHTVNTTGNIGIGTQNPSYKMHMVDPSAKVAVDATGGTSNPWVYFLQDNTLKSAVGWRTNNAGFTIYESGADRVVVASGSVGIGTTTPGSTLHVSGSVSTAIASTGSNITLTDDNHTIVASTSSTQTITLPAASSNTIGRVYAILQSGNGTVTVAANGSDTINGSGSVNVSGQYAGLRVRGISATEWIAVKMANP